MGTELPRPLVVFPLLVGCALGVALVGVMRLAEIGHRPTLWCGAILAAIAAVAGQHYFSFLDWRTAETARIAKQLEGTPFIGVEEIMPAAAPSFIRFMEREAADGRHLTVAFKLHGAAAWASWALDGLLVLVATLTIVGLACRVPYCSLCRTWYRTTRAGPLEAEAARRVAEAASLPAEELLGAARYRLSHCRGGCGPARLELAANGRSKAKVREAWLTAAGREQVVRVLDGAG